MKLSALNFDNANNACLSLHVLAELARRSEIGFRIETVDMGDGAKLEMLKIEFHQVDNSLPGVKKAAALFAATMSKS